LVESIEKAVIEAEINSDLSLDDVFGLLKKLGLFSENDEIDHKHF